MADIVRLGGRLLALPDTDFPTALRAIPNAPPILCVLGRIDLLHASCIAMVGARNASTHGTRLAAQLARDLASHGYVVVSGMARGIDAAAHAGSGPTHTIAVLAGGADVVYPRENQRLYDAIREQGCIVSEMPPGTEPQARHFPRRNRIVSGLALGVVVVEATAHSGSLITARLAAEQGREVMAVPGFPTDPRASGPNRLLKEGATLVESADDITAALSFPTEEPLLPGLAEASDTPLPSCLSGASASPEATDRQRLRLLESLTTAPLPVDVALRECQLSAAEGAVALLELELAGRIERLPG